MRGGGGAAGIAATVGMATGTETSKVSPGLRLGGMTTFMSWPLMLYWTVSPGDLYRRARLLGAEQKFSKPSH